MTKRIKSSLFIAMIAVATMGMDECSILAPEETDYSDDTDDGGSPAATGSYNYTYTCAWNGSSYTVPVPNRLSPSCRAAWEFYARTYGCNDADRFAQAEQQKRACP